MGMSIVLFVFLIFALLTDGTENCQPYYKNRKILIGNACTSFITIYILIQYIANYDEKYNGEGSKCCNDEMLTEDEFEKLIEENMDNPYINWGGIYYCVEERYRGREGYLDCFQRSVLWVLYKYRKQLNQKSNSNYW